MLEILPQNGWVAIRKIPHEAGKLAVTAVRGGSSSRELNDQNFALAVRYLLQSVAELRPGNSVELRVPPLGAVQCVEGPTHRRGTPPNVIEMDAQTWFALAIGEEQWGAAVADGRILASGTRADLSELLPLNFGFN
ncbi:MAG: hypothetical protein RL009_378 [Actinomycetota bacterium]|jgi:hypothetical protein